MSERTIQDLKHLAALEPDSAEAHFQFGTALLHGGQVAEAVIALRKAAKLAPESSSAHLNLGVALMRLRRIEEAESVQRRFVELNPDHAEMHTNLAYTLLLRGHFEEGWREHEWRWRQAARLAERRPFGVPQWKGLPAPRQTLLLHAEQGFGDTIQFLRYVPLVRGRSGARRVIFECPLGLHRLVAQTGTCKADVVRQTDRMGSTLPRFDQHLPLMSLPHALRLPAPSDPAVPAPPYLRADPQKSRVWRSRLLPTGNLRVGLVWAGNDKHPRDRERSISAALLAPLAAIPGVTFYSLQLRRSGIASAPDALLAVDFTPQLTDFSETAALVGELDLVISVDTAVAHLAGALDKPVWTLLDFAADWRWGTDGSRTAWYDSMRLFRQSTPGDWPAVLREVAAELTALADAHP